MQRGSEKEHANVFRTLENSKKMNNTNAYVEQGNQFRISM